MRFLEPEPDLDSGGAKPLAISNLPSCARPATAARVVKSAAVSVHSREQPLVLLTNGRGGMARLCVDFGAINSKYDCLLGANLNPDLPVDRHIFAKRIRVWVTADGFITPLDLQNLVSFESAARRCGILWPRRATAGRSKLQFAPTCWRPQHHGLHFDAPTADLATRRFAAGRFDVRLTVRVDIEDRNFHTETHRNGGADYHFSTNTHTLAGQIGFCFHAGGGPAIARLQRHGDLIIRSPNGARTFRTRSSKAAARLPAATPTVRAGSNCRWRGAQT